MKIVINKCYGGFSISKAAAEYMASLGCEQAKAELSEMKDDKFYGYGYSKNYDDGYKRDNEYLVKAVEHLGPDANNWASNLKVIEIPDGVEWEIDEYDGLESIHEKHRSW